MLENGPDNCPCVRKRCERFGKCAQCVEYHKTKSKKYPEPYCRREKRSQRHIRETDRTVTGRSLAAIEKGLGGAFVFDSMPDILCPENIIYKFSWAAEIPPSV